MNISCGWFSLCLAVGRIIIDKDALIRLYENSGLGLIQSISFLAVK